MGGDEQLAIRLADGCSMRIPRHWTDADGPPPEDAVRRDDIFTTESLRRLLVLVEAFLSRK
jgi:hypothetical protein